MNVNINVSNNIASKKLDIIKQPNRKEEFKKVFDKHELSTRNSSNKNVDEKYNKDENTLKSKDEKQSKETNKNSLEGSATKDSSKPEDNNKLKEKVINLVEKAIDSLKQSTEKTSKDLEGTDESTDEMAQIQQLLQLLSSMLQGLDENSATKNGEVQLNAINLEQFIGNEKPVLDTKDILKNQLSEIVALLEKSKENSKIPSEISEMLQRLTTEASVLKGDLNLLKVPSFQVLSGNGEDELIKDNLLKKVSEEATKVVAEISPKNAMESSSNASKDNKFSGNSSSEEKFLKNLLGEDKDEMKISKAVNFMNQFETVKTLDTSKVQTPNLVIDKNNFQVDVVKTIKFMEINNIKDLTVKMNPKELGEITIKLTMESGVMKANISAQNKDTYNLLNQHIQDISDKLKNMDIKIQSLDINIYEDSTFFSKDSNERNNDGRQNGNRGTNKFLEEDELSINNNYAIEENQVNKFV